MKTLNLALVAAAGFTAGGARADWSLVGQDRSVHSHSTWMWTFGVPTQVADEFFEAPGFGPFDQVAHAQFGNPPNINARADSSQLSVLGTDVITAVGRGEGRAPGAPSAQSRQGSASPCSRSRLKRRTR